MSIRIAFLVDYPEHIPTVAYWQWDEWDRDMLGLSLKEVESLVRMCSLHKDALDVNLIALTEDDQCVGTIELADSEFLPGYEGVAPWIGSMYIHPDWRGAGIARKLWQAAFEHAKLMKFPKLYTFTHTLRDEILVREGFCTESTISFSGHEWRVYSKDLTQS